MSQSPIEPAGWSFAASGSQRSEVLRDKLERALRDLAGESRYGQLSLTFLRTLEGWSAAAHGASADPGAHLSLLVRLGRVLAGPGTATGSSEFTSPHALGTNFHVTAALEPGAVPGAAEPDSALQPFPGSPYGDA